MPQPVSILFPAISLQEFSTERIRELLEQNGLGDLDGVFTKGASGRSRHRGRRVWCTELSGADGTRMRVFIKMSWGRMRFWPRMTDLKTGQWRQSLPVREWHGLCRLRRLGLAVPEPLAVFHTGLLRFRAAVVVREIPPKRSLFEMIRDGDWNRLPVAEQDEILADLLHRLSVIHNAGLGWRGTSTVHFFPERLPTGRWRVWLIDCEGIHPRASERTRRRDFNKFVKSLWQSGADAGTVRRAERLIEAAPGRRCRAA